METPSSLASGGKPLGTERLSARPLLPASAGATGRMFAEEVERAVERSRGSVSSARRLEGIAGARREARRASFGADRPEEDVEALPANYRREEGPVAARPALAPGNGGAEVTVRLEQASPRQGSMPAHAEGKPAAVAHGTAVPLPPNAGAPVLDAPASASVRAFPEGLAPVPPAPSEAQPAAPQELARSPAGRAARPAPAASPTVAPDPALLERAAEILRQIELHATSDVRRLTLELEPAELGRLSVQLALRARKVTAIVRGESAETLALLREHADELLAVFARRGIAADSVRFELGFGRPASGRRGAGTARVEPTTDRSATSPRSARSPRPFSPLSDTSLIDFYA